MTNQVLTNPIMVIPFIVVLTLFGLVLNWGIGKIFYKLDLISNKIAQKAVPFLAKFQFSILISELLFSALSILLLIALYKAKIWAFIPYITYSFINSAILYNLRKQISKPISFFDLCQDKIKRLYNKNYFINRLGYFFENGSSLIVLLVVLQITFQLFLIFEWPTNVYYIAYITLPLYVNFWIYFDKFRFSQDKDLVNIRRLIAYSFLVAYGFFNGYENFISFFTGNQRLDEYSLFFSISTVTFIAFERFTKALADDFKEFCLRKSSN